MHAHVNLYLFEIYRTCEFLFNWKHTHKQHHIKCILWDCDSRCFLRKFACIFLNYRKLGVACKVSTKSKIEWLRQKDLILDKIALSYFQNLFYQT